MQCVQERISVTDRQMLNDYYEIIFTLLLLSFNGSNSHILWMNNPKPHSEHSKYL